MGKILEEAYYSQSSLKKKPHYHRGHQILLILEGEVELSVNGISRLAGAGDLVLFSRYENHSVTVRSKSYARYVLQVEPPKDRREDRIFSVLSNRPKGFGNVLDVSDDLMDFEALFRQLVTEYGTAESMADQMQQLLVRQLLIRIYRRCPEVLCFYENEKYAAVFDLQRRFEERFAESYRLQDLAKGYALSVSSLCHRFKEATGMAVMDYLLSCRVAAAKQLLTDTQVRISDIVEQCGFSDCSNFSRTFKRMTGISPTAFRECYGSVKKERVYDL